MDTLSIGVKPEELTERAETLPVPLYVRAQRLVFHFQTEPQAVLDLLELLAKMKQEKLEQGFKAQDQPHADGPSGNVYMRAAGQKPSR